MKINMELDEIVKLIKPLMRGYLFYEKLIEMGMGNNEFSLNICCPGGGCEIAGICTEWVVSKKGLVLQSLR